MAVATALVHAVSGHLLHSSNGPARTAQQQGDTGASRQNNESAHVVGSVCEGRCMPLLVGALAECRHVLLLEVDGRVPPDRQTTIDGYRVVGLMHLAAGAMTTMVVLQGGAASSSPCSAALVISCVSTCVIVGVFPRRRCACRFKCDSCISSFAVHGHHV